MEIAESESLVQAWRSVSIGLTATVLGMSLLVLRAYFPHARQRKALPWHVSLMACSYALYVVAALVALIERWFADAPASYRLVVYPLAAAMGIVALTVIMSKGRRK